MSSTDNKGKADYVSDRKKISEFLSNYTSTEKDSQGRNVSVKKYQKQIEEIHERRSKIISIHLDDLVKYKGGMWNELIRNVEKNSMRYVDLFSRCIDELMPNNEGENDENQSDILDVLWSHRKERQQEFLLNRAQEESGQSNPKSIEAELAQSFPEELRRRYEFRFIPRKISEEMIVRNVKAEHIGRLVKVKGIVTRVVEVKPLIKVATYLCEECGQELYQEVNGRAFMPLSRCLSQVCTTNRTAGKISMQTRGSKFVKFQEIKIQELAEHVPIGHIPRQMTIHVYGELTRTCSAGEIVSVSGVFLTTPYVGSRFRGGLLADTYIHAMELVKFKKSYSNIVLTNEMASRISELSHEDNVYNQLSESIAPEIFGHKDVKKALLLLMVGGTIRHLTDGMKIRGDINVCLMGDPGVAKSQLLKHISTIAPRGIYTSGKGSSGVGLTAAVLRDPITGDLVLEGGSLVLADKGICCIDEFDKMDESDRTAIHEVMEQQTISIAKAGITTTLNARASILAAANPAFGRYNMRRSPTENINLPAALLSRFDLMFVLLDKANMESDMALAEHVSYVHRNGNRTASAETNLLKRKLVFCLATLLQ
eukprot:TRINITY_DN6304_c0_g1_i2.p1 TRINITY_DN6304_c0_g1~~TRINITY_DN6304_c0_g1_i2.p1  ORF type:complete len:596 (+),score=175.43 TRINITY_DN6304_c0_g1_i2:47-1834(+)